MKPQTALFILFALLLAACGTAATPTPAPQATATPQPTPTASATPTPAVPAEMPAEAGDAAPAAEFDPGFKIIGEPVTAEVQMPNSGLTAKITMMVGAKLDPFYKTLSFNENWSKDGLNSEQALTKLILTTFYLAKIKEGFSGSYADYETLVAKAQQEGTVEAWNQAAVPGKNINIIGTEGYDEVDVVLWPFYNGSQEIVPDGVKVFREVAIHATKVKANTENQILLESQYQVTAGKYGFGTSWSPENGGALYAHLGMTTADGYKSVTTRMVTRTLSLWTNSFVIGDPTVVRSGYYENKDMEYIFADIEGNKGGVGAIVVNGN